MKNTRWQNWRVFSNLGVIMKKFSLSHLIALAVAALLVQL